MSSDGVLRLRTLVRRSNWTAVLVLAGGELVPRPALAHVKWFCSAADVTQSPVALRSVLTPVFAAVCAGFVILVFCGFMVDGAVARAWPDLASSLRRHEALEEKLIRLAVGAYFLLLWDKGAVVLWERGDAILTPELMASVGWMGALHLVIAASVGWRLGCGLAAAGITILYGYGIAQFGLFHMTDYVFFPGLAAYLALTAIGRPGALRLRVPLLSGSLAFGLMWTAVEKFVYPEWTLFVVAEHPDLAFGFPWPFVVVVAGFVEFTLAFYVMTGRGLVRFGAAAYAAIFLAAIPEFGHLDAVGHIPVVAILLVTCLRGASPLPRLLGLSGRGAVADAGAIAGFYLVSLNVVVALYYALQWLEYG